MQNNQYNINMGGKCSKDTTVKESTLMTNDPVYNKNYLPGDKEVN